MREAVTVGIGVVVLVALLENAPRLGALVLVSVALVLGARALRTNI
jgi:hypothetical protein